MSKVKITGQFHNTSVDIRVARAAARAVVEKASSVEDARLLLDVLGLIPPQEGYKPYEHEDCRKERSRKRKEQFAEKRKKEKEARDHKNKIELESKGISLSEIGEGDEPEEPWEEIIERMKNST